MHKEKGFTLLELLMVVIIIAILASIALPQYVRATEKARGSEAMQLLGAIRSSSTRYKAQDPGNRWPTESVCLDIDVGVARYWGAVDMTTAAGRAFFARSAGTYSGQNLAINFATGNTCGSFEPVFPGGAAGC